MGSRVDVKRKTYSTGQIARMLDCSARTITTSFDMGDLVGYKLPHSKDRRVPHDNLIVWLNRHGLPIPPEIADTVVVLAGMHDMAMVEMLRKNGYRAVCSPTAVLSACAIGREHPVVTVIQVAVLGQSASREIKGLANDQGCKTLALATDDVPVAVMAKEGYDKSLEANSSSDQVVAGVVELIESRKER